jgi:hypothetical protein
MFEAMLPALMQGLSSPMAQAGIGLMSGMPMGQAMQMGNRKPQPQGPGLLGALASQTVPGTPANGGWGTTTTPTLAGLLGGRGFLGG